MSKVHGELNTQNYSFDDAALLLAVEESFLFFFLAIKILILRRVYKAYLKMWNRK